MKAQNRMRPVHPREILHEEFLVPLNMSAQTIEYEVRKRRNAA
jgi:plasmid maintenance system antidote protein VapI